ncbi:hypothetical protein PM082_001360 [Marasmius tenuissimus]|nr:hypothetical protein PM082_001360 [Marasmius tenuissimus]
MSEDGGKSMFWSLSSVISMRAKATQRLPGLKDLLLTDRSREERAAKHVMHTGIFLRVTKGPATPLKFCDSRRGKRMKIHFATSGGAYQAMGN